MLERDKLLAEGVSTPVTCECMYFSLNPGITERIASLTVDSDCAVKKELSSADLAHKCMA